MRCFITVFGAAFFLILNGCSDSSSPSSDEPETISRAPSEDETGESNLPRGSPSEVQSNFDDASVDGWTVTRADSAIVSTDGSCGFVQVEPSSGFLCADAVEGSDTSYFLAPAKFTGDLNVFSILTFDLVTDGGNYFNSGFGFDGDIVIANGVSKASYTFSEDQRPASEWRTYQIPLTDTENWIVDDGAPLPTVLQSATELRIRAEYGVGADNGGLDNVSLE